MLQIKDLWGRTVGEKVTVLDGKISEELEGPAGGLFPANKPGCKKRA